MYMCVADYVHGYSESSRDSQVRTKSFCHIKIPSNAFFMNLIKQHH